MQTLIQKWDMAYDTFSKYKGDGKCTELHINDCPDYHLSPLLSSVNFKELHLFTGSLNQEETEALVRAMTSRVEIVHLGERNSGGWLHVSLDFDTLTKYKGDGTCREVHCNYLRIGWSDDDVDDSFDSCESPEQVSKDKYIDATSAQTWAEKMNWDLEQFSGGYLLSRKKHI